MLSATKKAIAEQLECKSLEQFLTKALTEAAEAHAQCCHSDSNWVPFYALFVARRMAPLMCAVQTYLDRRLLRGLAPVVAKADASLNLPVAVVHGHWDAKTRAEASLLALDPNEGRHGHTCSVCGHSWSHADGPLDNVPAHTCRVCGNVEWEQTWSTR